MMSEQFFKAREEARGSFLQGNYLAVIAACDQFLSSRLGNEGKFLLPILNDKSRALRNLGRIQEALDCHVEALRISHSIGDAYAEAWQLVQFGKIFGKYLERQTLFSACLREAAHRYEVLMGSGADRKVTVQFAIVQDLLGSYYRRLAERSVRNPSAQSQSEMAYLKSIELHRSAGNWEGVSRAQCHLAYSRALFLDENKGSISAERLHGLREALNLFEQGVRLVLRLPNAVRGRATRRVQEAHIYLMLGKNDHSIHLALEALSWAEEIKDPRARVLAKKLVGESRLKVGRFSEAVQDFSDALTLAREIHLGGIERKILANLAGLWVKMGNEIKAIEAHQEIETLIKRELLEFSSGFRGAIDIFREVARDRADLYLIEGQQQDYESFIYELSANGALLRSMVERHEKSKSEEYQLAVYRFVKNSIYHSVKNELQTLALSLIRLRDDLESLLNAKAIQRVGVFECLDVCETVIDRIGGTLRDVASEDALEPASLKLELERALEAFFDLRKVVSELSSDLIFPHLMPDLLGGALSHLIENAYAAVKAAPPEANIPLFAIRQEVLPSGGQRILLMNPGINPQVQSLSEINPAAVHGFQTAQRFFREILGFDCRFELREDGPRTYPFKSNCVVLETPPPSDAITIYQQVDLGLRGNG